MARRALTSPFVVCLVATRERDVLLQRALATVALQTRLPDALIVVDDADGGPTAATTEAVRALDLSAGVERILLGHRRTRGAAGAWNAGLDEAARRFGPPESVIVAILDDDDEWSPDHLERCIGAIGPDVDVVAPDIVRHDARHPEGRLQRAPDELSVDVALVGNPHIQGSNLVARLSTLLESGLFDEHLPSTTDRDLVIRLADIGARYRRVDAATVHHDAAIDRPRLSLPASDAKRTGLARFLWKYGRRMTASQREAFGNRARELFGVDVASSNPGPAVAETSPPTSKEAEFGSRVTLVAGVVADGDAAGVARVEPLLRDLLSLHAEEGLGGLDVVLLENGDGSGTLGELVDRMNSSGLRCHHVTVARQREDALAGAFGPEFVRRDGRLAIAESRTLLQRYVRWLMRPGAIAWILDDDKRLDALVLKGGRELIRERLPVIQRIRSLEQTGASAVLGVDTGAAPLPAVATLRVQLVDLLSNLTAMQAMEPQKAWLSPAQENAKTARDAPDYYYDLARSQTAHLETPFWFDAGKTPVSVREAMLSLCTRAPRVLAGEQVFRPLFVEQDQSLTTRASIIRGGNTLVFDPDALVDVPQFVPAPDGRPSRRSDIVWALLNTYVRARPTVQAPFAVFHDRSDLGEDALNLSRIVDDIRGYALYSALADVFEDRQRRGLDVLALDSAGERLVAERHGKYLQERAAALSLAVHRSRGVAKAILRLIREPGSWWSTDLEVKSALCGLEELANKVELFLHLERVAELETQLAATEPVLASTYLGKLREVLATAMGDRDRPPPAWLQEERTRVARAQVQRLAQTKGQLRPLGAGAEGVVFTDGATVFKYFDHWSARGASERRAFLHSLVGKWRGTSGLYELTGLIEDGPHSVLVYPYEPSEPYTGGHGPGLVRLLREFRANGIACRNLHPKNLRVVGDNVRLVDYGADLRPLDDVEWRHMIRRAFLCWRWAHRSDLESLMKRALSEDIEELDGWERMQRAVVPTDAKEDLDQLILRIVHEARPGAVLDFGCGAGSLVRRLATDGVVALGYDVASNRRWAEQGGTLTTDRNLALSRAPFDLVVCSLVLCSLNDVEYREVIREVRAALRVEGTAVIAVCNPFHVLGGDTALQERHVEPGSDQDTAFTWTKQTRATGRTRADVHRPFHVLRRDLLRAGLLTQSLNETECVDEERFEPASDFLVLTARAIAPGPRVSLLIRASAMDWRTVEHQVRHIVDQFETPHAFFERIVVLDSRRSDFPRQHDEPDHAAARAAIERLVANGTIDQLVEAPTGGSPVAALHERWYGLSACEPHTVAGYPSAASLVGFEACSGDYILHLDADVLVGRNGTGDEPLRELAEALEADPVAVSAAVSIASLHPGPFTQGGEEGAWRVEARATLLHRSRLLGSRPWPNRLRGAQVELTWHRALDERIRGGDLSSLRRGRTPTFFIHPPNELKVDRDRLHLIGERIASGVMPAEQLGHVELVPDLHAWFTPKRTEPVVIVACGRNVPAGRVLRWRESLAAQTDTSWGVVVVEDGGKRASQEFVRHALSGWSSRATLLTPPHRRGGLANMVAVLGHIASEPETIVIQVDLDDALLGKNVLARVVDEFRCGADLVVGGMRRTDKFGAPPPVFDNARQRRGGGVWQHLHAFRRQLFDRVPDEALRLDGEYVDLAWDWPLMLGLVEAAESPRYIDSPCYLHEPSGPGKTGVERTAREAIINRIVRQPAVHANSARSQR
ncbi:MAG: glycosyltransferase [Deltaproteobacteria bacterium]|nr:glycosyltransferase [Deltaproteobacteria bacterium]